MTEYDDIVESRAKRLCYKCIGEECLKAEVRRKGQRGQCSYCVQIARSYTLDDMADRIETAFEEHFRRTSDEPTSWQSAMLADREFDYTWERDGEPVVLAIAETAGISEEAAQDIQAILDDKHGSFEAAKLGEETEFCSESHYEECGPDDIVWQEQWRYFEQSLKTEARFFSRTATAYLASIFGGIDKMSTTDDRPLVIDAGPQARMTAFYRARVFQSDERLKEALCRPDRHLGPPPPVLASAGRMNAHGISVFYGANNPDVAIAEVRPPVGSHVAVARFDIIRPLRLFDLAALLAVTEPGSVFDPEWITRLERATFLRSLSQRIAKPVMPDDEALEYLSTQAIADFLATENEPLLDGIVFPSVQTTGDSLNVVLFHKAARVEAMDIPEGTELDADKSQMSDDQDDFEYTVWENVPSKKPSRKRDEEDRWLDVAKFAESERHAYDMDIRDVTLRIDLQSVKVHIVQSSQFPCDVRDVQRHRLKKSDNEF